MGRLYELRYPDTDRPVYMEDAGHLIKISGIFAQGMGLDLLLLSPTATPIENLQTMWIIEPTLEDWCEFLRQTDDPVFFENNEHWNPKAIVRKQQRAISGAIQQKVWARDGFQCLYCGENDWSNFVSACRRFNKKKGAIDPYVYCIQENLDYDGLTAYLLGRSSLHFIGHL